MLSLNLINSLVNRSICFTPGFIHYYSAQNMNSNVVHAQFCTFHVMPFKKRHGCVIFIGADTLLNQAVNIRYTSVAVEKKFFSKPSFHPDLATTKRKEVLVVKKTSLIRILCLACLIGITMPVGSFASGSCPNHGNRYAEEYSRYQTDFTYLNNNSHQYTEIVYYQCTFCLATGMLYSWTHEYTLSSSHITSGTWNGSHLEGTTLHTLNHYCNKCSHNWFEYYYCSGNPCVLFNSIVNPTE